jgi:hypothetical protein
VKLIVACGSAASFHTASGPRRSMQKIWTVVIAILLSSAAGARSKWDPRSAAEILQDQRSMSLIS